MATRDFRSQQLRISQIIVSGSRTDYLPSLLIYSSSAATNDQGQFAADLTGSAGEDAWIFVSGSTHLNAEADQKMAQVLFGGNIAVSGSISGSTVSSFPAGDVTVKSDTGINFIIDNDNSQTNALFSFKTNGSTEVAKITETGDLQIDSDIEISGLNVKSTPTVSALSIDGSANVMIGGGSTTGNSVNDIAHTPAASLHVPEYIKHTNDLDTTIRFEDNKISFDAGAGGSVEVNPVKANVDFKVHSVDPGGESPSTRIIHTNPDLNSIKFLSTDDNDLDALKLKDVSFFVDGAVGQKQKYIDDPQGTTGRGVALFAGDVVVSGTLYAEKQVMDVDLVQDGQLILSQSMHIKNIGAAGSSAGNVGVRVPADDGAIFAATGTLIGKVTKDGTTREFRLGDQYLPGSGITRTIASNIYDRTFHMSIAALTASDFNAGDLAEDDRIAIADVSSTDPFKHTRPMRLDKFVLDLAQRGVRSAVDISAGPGFITDDSIVAHLTGAQFSGAGVGITGSNAGTLGVMAGTGAAQFLISYDTATSASIGVNSSGNLVLRTDKNNSDIDFRVDYGGSVSNALKIDGSEGGSALFTPADGGYLKVDDGGGDGHTKILGSGRIVLERNTTTESFDPYVVFRRSKGTEDSKSSPVDGDDLGSIVWYGYDGGTERAGDFGPYGIAASILVEAEGTHGDDDTTDSPGRMMFSTSTNNADEATERMRIDSTGKIGVNTIAAQNQFVVASGSLEVHGGDAIVNRQSGDTVQRFQLASQDKWVLGVDDSDSDKFKIHNGDLVDASKFSLDTDGNVGIAGDLTVAGIVSDLYVKGPEGTAANIYLQADEGDDSADTWQIQADVDGSNNFRIKSGAQANAAFGISATTNTTTLRGKLEVASDIQHHGDTTTKIAFDTEDIAISAGGKEGISITSAAGVVINDGHDSAMDFRVESDNDDKAIFVDSSLDLIAIGDPTIDALKAGAAADVRFFVSGSVGGITTKTGEAGTAPGGVAVVGGDLVVSGTLYNKNHQRLDSLAIKENGTFSTAPQATGANSFAAGNDSQATADGAFAIGNKTRASAVRSIALGSSTTSENVASGESAAALGGESIQATANFATAIGGQSNIAGGTHSVAMGRSVNVTGADSVGIGVSLTVPNDNTIAFGNNADNAKIEISGSLGVESTSTFNGNVTIAEGANLSLPSTITHLDDPNTLLQFDADQFRVQAGGNYNVDVTTNQVLILSGGHHSSPDPAGGTDVNFVVSGTIGSKDSTSIRGTAVFGGDLHISGAVSGPTQYSFVDNTVRIFRDGNVMKFDDGVMTVQTLQDLAQVSAANEFFLGVEGTSSTRSRLKTTASIAFAGDLDGYVTDAGLKSEGVGEDVYFFVSGSVEAKDGDARHVTLFGGDTIISGSTHVASLTGSTIISTGNIVASGSLIAGGNKILNSGGNPSVIFNNSDGGVLYAASATTQGGSAQSLIDVRKDDDTVFAASNEFSSYNVVLRNHSTTQNAFAGIAFDVANETDNDAIGASIAALREQTLDGNHKSSIVFSVNDNAAGSNTNEGVAASTDRLTEALRIHSDKKVQTAGKLQIGGNEIIDSAGITVLTFDGSGNVTFPGLVTNENTAFQDITLTGGDLTFGNAQNATVDITDTAENAAGKGLTITAGKPTTGGTNNIAGGALTLQGGQGKGTGVGGDIVFQLAPAAESGANTHNAHQTVLTLSQTGTAIFNFPIQVPNNDGIKNGDGEVVLTVNADQNVDVVGDLTAKTLNADGDISAGDNAAIGYTSTGGIIITGQGSNNDVTIKNDAAQVVLKVPTGTQDIVMPNGNLEMTGSLFIKQNVANVPAISVEADDSDVAVITFGQKGFSEATNDNFYGYALVYSGSGANVENTFAIKAGNKNISDITAMEINQSGSVSFGKMDGNTATFHPKVNIVDAEMDALADVRKVSNYHLALQLDNDTNDKGVGLAFLASTAENDVGASIIHKRTGSSSKGELQFYTKQSASDAVAPVLALTITDAGQILAANDVQAQTFLPTGDTSAADAAAIGYTSTEGIIITGQGSTNDVTIKNDADAAVIEIPTGTTNVDIVGVATAATFEPDGDTSAGDNAAIGYTASEGIIITGQGTTNDVTIKNDLDATVLSIPTGTSTVNLAGKLQISDISAPNGTASIFLGHDSNQLDFKVDAAVSGSFTVGTSSGGTTAALMNVVDTALDALADVGDPANYHLVLHRDEGTNDKGVGLGFMAAGEQDDIGGAIIYKKTGNHCQGELRFYTKQSEDDGVDPVLAMRINNTGQINASYDVSARTFLPTGDTTAGDFAAVGYSSGEGIVITGMGSTNDVTIKNDSDAAVIEIPTGTTNVDIAGNLTVNGGSVSGPVDSQLKLKADLGVIIELDDDNDVGANQSFKIRNGANTDVLEVDESGNLQADGTVSAITYFPLVASFAFIAPDTERAGDTKLIMTGYHASSGVDFYTNDYSQNNSVQYLFIAPCDGFVESMGFVAEHGLYSNSGNDIVYINFHKASSTHDFDDSNPTYTQQSGTITLDESNAESYSGIFRMAGDIHLTKRVGSFTQWGMDAGGDGSYETSDGSGDMRDSWTFSRGDKLVFTMRYNAGNPSAPFYDDVANAYVSETTSVNCTIVLGLNWNQF